MAAIYYGDLNKKAKDVLTKDFTSDYKTKVETVASNGVKFTANTVLGGDWDTQVKVPVCEYADVSFKVVSSGDLHTETNFKNFGVAGLKGTVKSSHNSTNALSHEVQLDYTQGTIAGKFNIKGGNAATVSAVVGPYRQTYAGVESSANLASFNAKEVKFDSTLSNVGADYVGVVGTRKGGQDLFASFFKSFGKDSAVAAELVYAKKNVSASLAGYKVIDAATTLKGKYETNGTFTGAVVHTVRRDIVVTLSSAFDLSKAAAGKATALGINIAFTD